MYAPARELRINARSDSPEFIDFSGFLRYCYSHRKVIIIAALTAAVIAAVASVVSPKKYTATASILIEPPAGADARGATAVSPIYLESLKTYEHFASSDSLFEQALAHLKLRSAYSGVALETLKRRVLKVSKPRETKILEISATLKNPAKAQQFAQYIAEQAVKLNRSLATAATQDLGHDTGVLLQAARTRLENARKVRESYIAREPIAEVEARIAGTTDMKSRVDRNLLDTQVELAAYQARYKLQIAGTPDARDTLVSSRDIAAIEAEISALQLQSNSLTQLLKTDSALLERRKHEREVLDKEVQAAQAQYEAAAARNSDILSSSSFRGERLEIVDPGVIPERPSSPNLSLNISAALLVSIVGSVLYLAIRFAYSRNHLSTHRGENER